MFKIVMFKDSKGHCDVEEYLSGLKAKVSTNKDARINFVKTIAYIDALKEYGLAVGEPAIKHLDGKIWELRPLSYRILFATVDNECFVLLHHFRKKTQKTPRSEINKAKRELDEYIGRKTL